MKNIVLIPVGKFYRAFHLPNSELFHVMRVRCYNIRIGSPYIDGIEEEGPVCIFIQKGLSDLWKNTEIQKVPL